jgi:hypothetical protein
MAIRKSRFTIVMMWAMIPLIVFGSLPRMGCICANGQHKVFCERHREGTAGGQCACCDHAKLMASSKAGPDANVCCRSHGDESVCESPALDTSRPCRPIVDRAVLLTAAKSSLDRDGSAHTPLFVAVQLLPSAGPSIAADYTHADLLPPPDLVITLGVMLI